MDWPYWICFCIINIDTSFDLFLTCFKSSCLAGQNTLLQGNAVTRAPPAVILKTLLLSKHINKSDAGRFFLIWAGDRPITCFQGVEG